MKKVLHILITILIIVGVAMPGIYLFDDFRKEEAAYEFCRDVKRMNEKTDIINDSASEMPEQLSNHGIYRLIVKTDQDISALAIDRAIGNTYSLFAYESEKDMLAEKSKFEKNGYLLEQDGILQMASSANIGNEAHFNEYRAMCVDEVKNSYASKTDGAKEIVIGVIDSGIYVDHSVFTDRLIFSNLNLSSSGEQNSIVDDNGHGTSVASIIALSTPDNVMIKGYKILDNTGHCYTSTIVSVLDYIANEKNRPDIINLSLCGYDLKSDNSITYDALKRVIAKGVTVCAAAGNDNVQAKIGNICGCNEVIAVASCDMNGDYSTFSNYGKDCIDITAVGENIYSADIGTSSYSSKSGTSFACPFVASACAYILMENPSFTPANVEEYLKYNACSRDNEENYGKGILNFRNITNDYFSKNAFPSLPAGAYNGESVTLAFDVPDGYELYYGLDSLKPNLLYESPVTISENTVVYYALKNDNGDSGRVDSSAYEINYVATGKDASIKNGSLIRWENAKKNTNIIIPESLNSQKITSIGVNAFENAEVCKVYLPESVDTIENGAFKNSTIEHIEGNGVTVLKTKENFYGCTRLNKVVLPNVTKIAPYSFFNCSSLHYVDFDEKLTNLGTASFAYSGLTEADFPNIYNSSYVPTKAFESSAILTCNLPNLSRIGDAMFKNAKFLYSLNVDAATTLGSQAFYAAGNLSSVNLKNIETFYKGALTGCYIEKIYMPKVEQVAESLSTYSHNLGCEYVMCKVIDMPSLKNLDAGSIRFSTAEELYFDSAKYIEENSLCNMSALKIGVFSKAYRVYLPAVENSNDNFKALCAYPTADIIYAPKAILQGKIKDCNVVYSGGREDVELTAGKKKLTVITNNSSFSYRTHIIAPSSLYRANIVYTVLGSDTSATNIFEYDRIKFSKAEDGYLIYKLGTIYKFSIPAKAAQRIFGSDDLNVREDSVRKRLLDINGDEIINAKDFAIIHNNIL